jgi:hypothetical protein
MSRNVVYTGLAVVLVAVIAGLYFYNIGHKDLKNKTPDVVITTPELFKAYSADEEYANEIYMNKIVEVVGVLEKIEVNQDSSLNLILASGEPMGNVICTFENPEAIKESSLKAGDNITVKGICKGMLLDVLLNNCVLME